MPGLEGGTRKSTRSHWQLVGCLPYSASGRDFPSALVRFLLCVGVEPNICPPRRPDKNPYVERYHRSFGKECLDVLRPGTKEEVQEATDAFFVHYNTEQPNQALSCGNR